MKPNIPIALGAGIVATVVFLSATTGPTIARLLLLAAVTLPIALAGYSYNAATGFAAAAAGTLLIVALTTLPAGLAFALTLAFPAAIIVYLTLLHRESTDGESEWYPIGRVIVATALMSATIVAAGLLIAGTTSDGLHTAVRASIDTMVKSGFGGLPGGGSLSEADLVRATDIMTQILPGASAAFWMLCILTCQWIAARVALASGQLTRPWPDLAAFSLPVGTPLILSAAIAATLVLEGMPRIIVTGYVGALYAIYVLMGLAIVHYVSRGAFWRGPALSALYVLLIVFNSGASLLLALLALADSFIPIRRKP